LTKNLQAVTCNTPKQKTDLIDRKKEETQAMTKTKTIEAKNKNNETKNKSNETKNELNIDELLAMPVTVAPSGLNLYVMQLNAVTGGNTKIVPQGAEWLRLENYTKEQHEAVKQHPVLLAGNKALLSYMQLKSLGAERHWIYTGRYSNERLNKIGVNVDPESRIISIQDANLLMGNNGKPPKTERANKAAGSNNAAITQLTAIAGMLATNQQADRARLDSIEAALADNTALIKAFMTKVGA
jgi:hypothetical protein